MFYVIEYTYHTQDKTAPLNVNNIYVTKNTFKNYHNIYVTIQHL